MKVTKCDRCNGKGTIPSIESLVKARVKAGMQQTQMAVALGISVSFLCDLEHGRRQWDRTRAEAFLSVCKNNNHTKGK